ncbi:MAG: SagB/ThcOx family dehydrogenase [Desulfobacterales bacterium]
MRPANNPQTQTVIDYHERTKHHFDRMARSPGFMDWANQPDPFRRYRGAPAISLPLSTADPSLDYDLLYNAAAPAAAPPTRTSIAAFLELALGLSAWKALGRDRWALRINPSSGNLHPTEAYLFLAQVKGLADGLYHYAPREHLIERRITATTEAGAYLRAHCGGPALLVALSSVIWREAWKYGERAFRYAQHDIGHALAALCFAARLLGWRLTCLPGISANQLSRLLGFDRTAWPPLEEETPELLCLVTPADLQRPLPALPPDFIRTVATGPIEGQPNPLSPARRHWEAIQRVEAATRPTEAPEEPGRFAASAHRPERPVGIKAAEVIRRRRSAVAFDYRGRMDRPVFFDLLARTLPMAQCPPFDIGLGPPRISLVLFLHQVTDLAPGIYVFIRHPAHRDALRAALNPGFTWQPASPTLPLFLLQEGDCRAAAADLACRQEIAGSSVFSLAMLAAFETTLSAAPWRYRQLFWEAGLIGQVLYLEAEARGYRGTGIGCYYDDPVHQLLGIQDTSWQDLYHFTVGVPLDDPRLRSFPPYSPREDTAGVAPVAER